MTWKILGLLILGCLVLCPPFLPAEKEWNEYKAQHFIIYYKDAPMDFVKNVESTAESYYEEITQNLGFTRYKSWSWDERAKIYIFRDAQDYLNTAHEMRWSHGAASVREKTIRTFPAAHGFFDSTLPHELGHIIFREFVGYSARVPTWLEEGIAMYQEKAKRWGATETVRQAMRDGSFMDLMQLTNLRLYSNTPQETIELFYAESASVVYFMITELGDYRFVNLCKRLKDGESFENALLGAYVRFDSIEDLNKVWLQYLQQ